MDTRDQILIVIGRIEGKLEALATLSQRVSTLERWQWFVKGGWFVTVTMCAWLFHSFPWR